MAAYSSACFLGILLPTFCMFEFLVTISLFL